MATDFGDYLANALLGELPTLYAAPSSTPPNLDGTNVTPPAQGDYVRPALSLAAASGRVRVTNAVADFISGGGAASGSAGSFAYLALYDASTSGNFCGRTTLTTPLAWVVGQHVEIAAGDITIGLPGS